MIVLLYLLSPEDERQPNRHLRLRRPSSSNNVAYLVSVTPSIGASTNTFPLPCFSINFAHTLLLLFVLLLLLTSFLRGTSVAVTVVVRVFNPRSSEDVDAAAAEDEPKDRLSEARIPHRDGWTVVVERNPCPSWARHDPQPRSSDRIDSSRFIPLHRWSDQIRFLKGQQFLFRTFVLAKTINHLFPQLKAVKKINVW